MHCALYQAGRCRSCQWLEKPYPQQLSDKPTQLTQLLNGMPVALAQQGFRNKAKMVVSGSVEKPLFGMVARDGEPVDLCACPLYPASFAAVFDALKPFIARAGLTP
ncbi:23S rRNA (uracil-5-)-methyltransferase RumB [Plautia stali symbiont]|nr:23S rRNA (uracil-5-)-methyltransferase RumB [Plautia stali symbiont]